MRKRIRKDINLLELTPAQTAGWENSENGTVVVLVPKFTNQLLVRWLVPHLRYPDIRIKLDKLGSFVWKQCDGKTTVSTIVDRLQSEFGDSVEAAQDRVHRFLLMLEKSELVNLEARQSELQQA